MEITLLIIEYHGNVLLNFCGNPERSIFSIYGQLIFLSPAHVYLTEYEDLKSMLLLSHYLGHVAKKPVFGSSEKGESQTSLLSYRD